MRKIVILLIIFLLISFNLLNARGKWIQVRKADFEVNINKIMFVNEQKGWMIADIASLLLTNDGGASWQYYQFSNEILSKLTGSFENIFFFF